MSEREFGIPIVYYRILMTPVHLRSMRTSFILLHASFAQKHLLSASDCSVFENYDYSSSKYFNLWLTGRNGRRDAATIE